MPYFLIERWDVKKRKNYYYKNLENIPKVMFGQTIWSRYKHELQANIGVCWIAEHC